jgi:hypothetical protein
MWLPLCGVISFLSLVCHGLCLEELSTYLLAGGRLEGQGLLRFGRWCRFASFGVYVRKEIIGVSRTWRDHWRIF